MKLMVKNLLCWLGYCDWIGEYCHDCGCRQPIVWWAGATLWYDVGCEQSTILCPRCFSERAGRKGYFVQWWPHACKRDSLVDAPRGAASIEELCP